jgi:methyltransferase (TIGR00027 family)
MHLQVDDKPPIFEDEIGLKLVAPEAGWRDRPDMHPEWTKYFQASIVARARFVEDLVVDQVGRGVGQYVILGAGLDSFVQRRPEMSKKLQVFEVDQPSTQAWKVRRLAELGFGVPDSLKFVPVDFEAGEDWKLALQGAGFDSSHPVVVASTGVSMYLTKDAVFDTLHRIAQSAPGSTLAMTFIFPIEMVASEIRVGMERAVAGAKAAGTPFVSFFRPEEMTALAREAGFQKARHVSSDELAQRYFSNRKDGFRPFSGEEFLVATV